MKPVDQEFVHDADPDLSIEERERLGLRLGDCWRAAIASALEANREDVPHFAELGREYWWPATLEFLAELGLGYVEWEIDDPEGAWAPDAVTLLTGPSPRNETWDHTVVGKGLEMTHDPHPSRAGIVRVTRIGVFIVLDPAEAVRDRAYVVADAVGEILVRAAEATKP